MTRSYATNLRKGRIESPGYEKLAAIAKALGFAPEAWFADGVVGKTKRRSSRESQGITGRGEHLFDAVNNPRTGERYTNVELARMTLGDLSKEEVDEIKTGAIGDPIVGQGAALAGIFGMEPSYLLDQGEPVFDHELVEALRVEAVWEATREIARLPERERPMVLGIVRLLGNQQPNGYHWPETVSRLPEQDDRVPFDRRRCQMRETDQCLRLARNLAGQIEVATIEDKVQSVAQEGWQDEKEVEK